MKYLICTLLIIGNIGQLFCQINDTVQDIGSDCVGQENSIISPKVIDYVYWGRLYPINCVNDNARKKIVVNLSIKRNGNTIYGQKENRSTCRAVI